MTNTSAAFATSTRACSHCSIVISDRWNTCPHCGRPARFRNVLYADRPHERDALEAEHLKCLADATRAGKHAELAAFGAECRKSRAVFCCTLKKLTPIVTAHIDLYADFYSLAKLRCSPQTSDRDWETLRVVAETHLTEGDSRDVPFHYAALSLDGLGSAAYGECTVTFADQMIAHRATVFPENSALFFEKNPAKPPPGLRALWSDRHKTCMVKCAGRLAPSSKPAEFPKLLLDGSTSGLDDWMIEVHVTGPVTIRSFEKLRIPKPSTLKSRVFALLGRTIEVPRPDQAAFDACKEYCDRNSVAFEVY